MKRLFISYNRNDEPIVETLARDLEGIGHDAWFDKEITGGHAWWESILRRVRDCDAFLFALSAQSLKSRACQTELGYALALGKPVLPVMISAGVASNLLPRSLASIQYVDFRSTDRAALVRLLKALQDLPDAPPAPDPLPEPPPMPLSYLVHLAGQIDGGDPLGFEQQTGLATKLRGAMEEPDNRGDAIELLKRLRKRHDLLAIVAQDIDSLLSRPISPRQPASKTPQGTARPARPARAAPESSSVGRLTPAEPPTAARGSSSTNNGLAVASLVCGVLSPCTFLLGGIPAVVCGILAIKRANAEPARGGKGMAVAGIVLGSVGILFGLLALISGMLDGMMYY